MAKTLTAYNTTETAKTLTQPYYLIELGFSTPLYYSTLHAQTLGGKSYLANRKISVDGLSPDNNGNVNCTLSIGNADNAISVLALSESPQGLTVTIYEVYGETPTTADMILRLSGKLGGAEIDDSIVRIKATNAGFNNRCPGLVIAKPHFNWLPSSGTVINTGKVNITLRSARG